ncbi:hypothetical protein PanWU01x14_306380 [Parasponia andersonii]|uniref:Uncharacterized protein n=1 Tax=Parasponia andersonii TaxID=3476 RepID=A0A2P5ARU4_PARAD|nr:hypothetical protein PanWU01x14_306380 [Parasponia andersonii]
MAPDEVLNLFDSNWFGPSIFSTITNPSHDDHDLDDQEQNFPENLTIQGTCSSQIHDQDICSSPLPKPNHLNIKSQSEYLSEYSSSPKGSFFSDSQLSPSSVLNLNTPKLQTIFSRKEVKDFPEQEENTGTSATTSLIKEEKEEEAAAEVVKGKKKVNKRRRRKVRNSTSKSLTDLEFEELKGFMDLGFVFTEEECRDSKLVSIIPGLQRLAGKKQSEINGQNREVVDGDDQAQDQDIGSLVSRPYLSEAWDVLEIQRKEEKSPLMSLKIPISGNEIDMKDRIRFWAHSVALSTVR